MKTALKRDRIISIVFKTLYLLLVFLSFNSIFAHTTILKAFSVAMAVIGGCYFLYRFFQFRYYKKTTGLFLLIAFVLSYVLSSIVTREFNYSENIQATIWMIIQFALLYATDSSYSKEDYKKEIHIIFSVILVYTTIMAIAGIIMFLTRYNSRIPRNGTIVIMGYLWNRLFGTYTDPNYGAVFSIVSSVISIYFISIKKSIGLRICLSINIMLQIVFIALTDSRTGLLSMMVTIFFLILLLCIKSKFLEQKSNVLKALFSIILAVAIAFAAAGGITLIKKAGTAYQIITVSKEKEKKHQEVNTEEIENKYQVGRKKKVEAKTDVSNRRFSIWKSALEIFATKPITGVSFRNLVPYAKAYLPETYIVNNDHTDFASMHNIVFDILVSQGMIGLLIMLFFVIKIVILVIKSLVQFKGDDYKYLSFLVCIILPILCSTMFYSEVLYINTGGAMIFWSFLGILMHFINKTMKQSKNPDGKKTGIFTLHRARNHGACLQAYALQTKLESLGANVEIVDYRPAFVERDFGLFVPSLRSNYPKGMVGLLSYCVSMVLHLPFRAVREWRFKQFRQKHYHLTDLDYKTEDQLHKTHLDKEIYIFGSDQIWSPHITNGVHAPYYGNSVEKDAVCCSYAASIGSKKLSVDDESKIKTLLKRLDVISVREEFGKEVLLPLTEKEIFTHLDPAFLLTTEEWEALCGKPAMDGSYILVYALVIDEQLIEVARQLANKNNMPIVFFDIKNRYGTKAISRYSADPIQFISYIKSAAYVVTNSFHGTAFSLIFKKQFIAVPNPDNPLRITELLTKVGAQNQIVSKASEQCPFETQLDYTLIDKTLDRKRKDAISYLGKIIRMEK